MRRIAAPVVAAFLVGLVAGCAAPMARNGNSVVQSRLADAESRAAAQARTGDYAGAARHYGEALRLATALENADAIAANAINLSVVQQWLGHDAEARAALAAVLDDPRTSFSERRRLQAELRRAILDLSSRNLGAAAVWAGQAERHCPELRCEYAATILNVRAQIELESGRAAEAAPLAAAAAQRARSSDNRAETANALRTLGRARGAQGDQAAALEALRQALDLDRELGDPRKILADLAALTRASEAAGDASAANDYKARSVAVSRAMNEGRGASEMNSLLTR